jgi:SAM-dependent methyltransferase
MAKRQSRKRATRGSKVIYEEGHDKERDKEHDPKPQLPAEEEGVRDPEPQIPKPPAKTKREKKSDEPSRAGLECPACGGDGRRRRSSRTVRCGTCHTVFREGLDGTGRAAEIREALFAGVYGGANHEERHDAKALAREAMRGFFTITRAKPAALNAFGKNVLEVDCGFGFRLRAFQDYGWTVMGTETSATACEYARRQSVDVRSGSLGGIVGDGGFGRTKFDLVFFCGSFGRVGAPHAAVAGLHDVMSPGGIVCVLREPMASRRVKLTDGSDRLILYAAEPLRRVFCEHRFSFVSEEVGEGKGTFWFKAKHGSNK